MREVDPDIQTTYVRELNSYIDITYVFSLGDFATIFILTKFIHDETKLGKRNAATYTFP